MANRLNGKKILVITSNTGVERDELLSPVQSLSAEGALITHASLKGGAVQTVLHDTEKDQVVDSVATIASLSATDFDVLVIPGGTVNADKLRVEAAATDLLRQFADASKPVAAICHGPWLLIDAGIVEGKTLTSYKSIAPDLKNAGASEWLDQEVVRCPANGWTLITSRSPKDLSAFSEAIVHELAAA